MYLFEGIGNGFKFICVAIRKLIAGKLVCSRCQQNWGCLCSYFDKDAKASHDNRCDSVGIQLGKGFDDITKGAQDIEDGAHFVEGTERLAVLIVVFASVLELVPCYLKGAVL